MLMLLACGVALGQSQRRTADVNNDLKAITAQLSSKTPEQVNAGVQAIREMLQQQPTRAVTGFRGSWGQQLLEAKRYGEVDELAEAMMLASPADSWVLEPMLQLRIRAALNSGRPQQAAKYAKQLYNVCQMTNTTTAMALLAECLNTPPSAANARLNQFRDEQLAGATTQPYAKEPAAIYVAKAATASATLTGIAVDGEKYLEKARTFTSEDYTSLVARVNLFLLADRPADALVYAERGYSMAPEGSLQPASDMMARCMKAADGTIGRANAWLISIRPRAAK
jgi:hypothetical protein